MRYVVGFAFWRNQVLLLLKKKGPSYVVGKLNGVGGKIEPLESACYSMVREFLEETGIETDGKDWSHFAIMDGEGYELNCFEITLSDLIDYSKIKNPEPTGEDLSWVPLDNLTSYGIVENLSWLIPLALDHTTPLLEIRELL